MLIVTMEGQTLFVSEDFRQNGSYWSWRSAQGRLHCLLAVILLLSNILFGIAMFNSAALGDPGTSWRKHPVAGTQGWEAITSSADGTKLAAVAGGMGTGISTQAGVYTSSDGGVTWTQQTGAGSRYWASIDMSADGTKLVAVTNSSADGSSGGNIYTSSDGGVTWAEQANAGSQYWSDVAMSADGTHIAAVVGPLIPSVADGDIYTSSDGGVTWTQQTGAGSRSWESIAMSADGAKLVAATNAIPVSPTSYYPYGDVYTSSDGGVTWTQQTGAGQQNWSDITMSSDGTRIAATSGVPNTSGSSSINYIHTSSDGGVTWTQQTGAGQLPWKSISSSADGMHIVAAAAIDNEGSEGHIYTSADGGATWTSRTQAGSRFWSDITMNDDGTHIAATAVGTNIYTSSDSGGTWNYATPPEGKGSTWNTIGMSANGTHIAAGVARGDLYTSHDGGATWSDRTSAGSRSWHAIAVSDDGTHIAGVAFTGSVYVSTDSGATWTTQVTGAGHGLYQIAMSGDGTKIITGGWNGNIYTSVDSGMNWTVENDIGPGFWSAIAMSSDGTKLMAADGGYNAGNIYTSTDSGATWTTQTNAGSRYWSTVAMSSDGTKLMAAERSNGQVYISNDSGATWASQTTPGLRDWISVSMSADGNTLLASGYYGTFDSADGGTTWVDRSDAYAPAYNSKIAMSADGTKLATAVYFGDIWTWNYGDPWDLAASGGYNAVTELGQTDGGGNLDWAQSTINNNQGNVNAIGMNNPSASALDSANHRLFITDPTNNRILVYQLDNNNRPLSQTPAHVLGQADFTNSDGSGSFCGGSVSVSSSTMCYPNGVAYDTVHNRLFVSDYGNFRILAFDATPATLQNGQAAESVIGVPDFTTDGSTVYSTASNDNVRYPSGLAYDQTHDRLFVSDTFNNRVLVFNTDQGHMATYGNGTAQPADSVIGQSNFTDIVQDSTRSNFNFPYALAYDTTNQRLFVSDSNNHRVLAFDANPASMQNGENASHVFGQANFTSNEPSTVQVVGPGTTTRSGLYFPYGLTFDTTNQRLFVSDSSNNRVLAFDANPATIQNGSDASHVLGQTDFVSGGRRTTQSNLHYPVDASYDPVGKQLFVVDNANSRIMLFAFARLQPQANAPNGLSGSAYSFNTGAQYQGNSSFSVTSGTLPPGTILNSVSGVISGIPTAPGNYTFTINLSDNNGLIGTYTDSQTYTVQIGTATSGGSGGSSSSGNGNPSPIIMPGYSRPIVSTKPATSNTNNTAPLPVGGTIVNLNEQPGYTNGSGFTATSDSSQSYIFTAQDGSAHGLSVEKVGIDSATLNFSPGNTLVTIKTGQTIEQSVTGSGKPDIRITLSSIKDGKASFVLSSVHYAGNTSPNINSLEDPAATKEIKNSRLRSIYIAASLAFPWLLFILLDCISLVLGYRAYKEHKLRRDLEEQLARGKSLADQKKNFITLSSHYLRTPLTLISNGIELATMDSSPAVQQEFNAQVDALKRVVGDLVSAANKPQEAKTISSTITSATKKITATPRYILLSLVGAFVAIGISDLILTKVNLYNVPFITLLEQIAAVVLATIVMLTMRHLYVQRKALNEDTMQLVTSQSDLSRSRDALIEQTLLVMESPLNAIKSKLNELSESKNDTRLTAAARSGIDQFESMLNKFMLITLLDSDTNNSVKSENIDLGEVIKNLLSQYESQITSKNLALKTDLSTSTIQQNKALLSTVIDSLISNAVKYSSESKDILIASSRHKDETRIAITNYGSAIDKDKLDQIFEPFSRAEDAATNFSQEGIGLSLYIDTLILNYLGGTIAVKETSTRDQTTFEIRIKDRQ